MGKLFQFGLTLITFCVLHFSNGLECYQCAYIKGKIPGIDIPGFTITDKCKKKVPKDYKTTCPPYPSFPPIFSQNNYSLTEDEDPTCAKVQLKIDNTDALIIFRSCVDKNMFANATQLLGTCTSGNGKKLFEEYNVPIPEGVNWAATSVDICFCEGDACNSGVVPKAWMWMSLLGLTMIFLYITNTI